MQRGGAGAAGEPCPLPPLPRLGHRWFLVGLPGYQRG